MAKEYIITSFPHHTILSFLVSHTPSCLPRTVAAEVRKQVSRERSGSPHSSRRSSSSLGVSPCAVADSRGVHAALTLLGPVAREEGVLVSFTHLYRCRGVCMFQGWSGGDTSFLDHPDGAPGWWLEETSCLRGKGWGLRNYPSHSFYP